MTIIPEQTLSQEDRELPSTMVDKVGHIAVIQELVDQWTYWLNGHLVGGIDEDMKKRLMLVLIGMLGGRKE